MEEDEEEEPRQEHTQEVPTTWPLDANVVSFEPAKFGSDYTLCDTD